MEMMEGEHCLRIRLEGLHLRPEQEILSWEVLNMLILNGRQTLSSKYIEGINAIYNQGCKSILNIRFVFIVCVGGHFFQTPPPPPPPLSLEMMNMKYALLLVSIQKADKEHKWLVADPYTIS
jgi:hypothetical protein